jgi:hypothetical protein
MGSILHKKKINRNLKAIVDITLESGQRGILFLPGGPGEQNKTYCFAYVHPSLSRRP